MTMTSCTVWYDRWQMDCCGTPFAVGSRICWPVVHQEHPLLPEDLRATLGQWDYDFDSHDYREESYYTLCGTVIKIHGVYFCYRLDKRMNAYIPDSGLVLPTQSVGETPRSQGDARLDAWLVRLDDVALRPLRPEDEALWT